MKSREQMHPTHPATVLMPCFLLCVYSPMCASADDRNTQVSLRERYCEPPRSLSEAAGRAWAPIRKATFDFDTRRLKAQYIEEVSLQVSKGFPTLIEWERLSRYVGRGTHQAV